MIIRKSKVVKCFIILILITSIVIESKPTRITKKIVCPFGHYYDLESRACKKVPCGGTFIHEDTSLRCTGRFLGIKVHPTYQQYYYICNPSSVVFVKCPENQIFNSTISHCQPSGTAPSDCKRTGRFPISSNCSLFYICDTDGQKLVRKLMECPKNTVFNPKTQRCSCVHQCTPTEVDPDDYFEDYDEDIFPPCTRPGRFRSPTDCSFYYTCSAKTNGKFYQTRYRCPVGTYYDIQREKCRNERRVKCDLMTVEELIKEYEKTHNYNESDVSAESAELGPSESTTVIPIFTTPSDFDVPDIISNTTVPAAKTSTDFGQYEGRDEDYGIPNEYYPEIDSENHDSKQAITTAKYENIEPVNQDVQNTTIDYDSSMLAQTEPSEVTAHISSVSTPSPINEQPVHGNEQVSTPSTSITYQADISPTPTISHLEESSLEEEHSHKPESQVNEGEDSSHSIFNSQSTSTPIYNDITDIKTTTQSLVDEKPAIIDELFTTASYEADNDSKPTNKPHSTDETITVDAGIITEKPVTSINAQDYTTDLPYLKPDKSGNNEKQVDLDSISPSYEVTENPMNFKSPTTSAVSKDYDIVTPVNILTSAEGEEITISVTPSENKRETSITPLKEYTISEPQSTHTLLEDSELTETKLPEFKTAEESLSTLTIQHTTMPTKTEVIAEMNENLSTNPQDGVTVAEESSKEADESSAGEEARASEKSMGEPLWTENPTKSVPEEIDDSTPSTEVLHDLTEHSSSNQVTSINKTPTTEEFTEFTTVNPPSILTNSSYSEEFKTSQQITELPEASVTSVVQADIEIQTTFKDFADINGTPSKQTTMMELSTLPTETESFVAFDRSTKHDDYNITEATTMQENVILTTELPIINQNEPQQLSTVDNTFAAESSVTSDGPVTQEKNISAINKHTTNSPESYDHPTEATDAEFMSWNWHSTEMPHPQSDSLVPTDLIFSEFKTSTEHPETEQLTDQPTKKDWAEPLEDIEQLTDQPTKKNWAEPLKDIDASFLTTPIMISEETKSAITTSLIKEQEASDWPAQTNHESTTISSGKSYTSVTMGTTINVVLDKESTLPMNDGITITPSKGPSENISEDVDDHTNMPKIPHNWSVESEPFLPTEENNPNHPTDEHETNASEKHVEQSTLSPPKTTADSDFPYKSDEETEVTNILEVATTALPTVTKHNSIPILKPTENKTENYFMENVTDPSNEQRILADEEATTPSSIKEVSQHNTEKLPEIPFDASTHSHPLIEDFTSEFSTTTKPVGQAEAEIIGESDEITSNKGDVTAYPHPFTARPSPEDNISSSIEAKSQEDHTTEVFPEEIVQEKILVEKIPESLSPTTVSSQTSSPQDNGVTDSIPFNTPLSPTTEGSVNISCTKFDEGNMTALHLENKSVEVLDVHISKPLKLLLHFHPKFSCDECGKGKNAGLKVRESEQKELKTLYLTF